MGSGRRCGGLVLVGVVDEVELKALLCWLDICLRASLLFPRGIHPFRGNFSSFIHCGTCLFISSGGMRLVGTLSLLAKTPFLQDVPDASPPPFLEGSFNLFDCMVVCMGGDHSTLMTVPGNVTGDAHMSVDSSMTVDSNMTDCCWKCGC